MLLWEAFLEDYDKEIFNWSIRRTLELFWYYCQDGPKAVYDHVHKLNSDKSIESAQPNTGTPLTPFIRREG